MAASEMETGAQENFEALALHSSAASWPRNKVCRSQAGLTQKSSPPPPTHSKMFQTLRLAFLPSFLEHSHQKRLGFTAWNSGGFDFFLKIQHIKISRFGLSLAGDGPCRTFPIDAGPDYIKSLTWEVVVGGASACDLQKWTQGGRMAPWGSGPPRLPTLGDCPALASLTPFPGTPSPRK